MFIVERVVRNDSQNSIQDTSEYQIKRNRLSENNTINEYVEENANSLYFSAEEEASESRNKWDWIESQDSDSNLDSDFELHSE